MLANFTIPRHPQWVAGGTGSRWMMLNDGDGDGLASSNRLVRIQTDTQAGARRDTIGLLAWQNLVCGEFLIINEFIHRHVDFSMMFCLFFVFFARRIWDLCWHHGFCVFELNITATNPVDAARKSKHTHIPIVRVPVYLGKTCPTANAKVRAVERVSCFSFGAG